MTIIGEAELDIRAVGDHFTSDVTRTVQPGMKKAGDQAEHAAQRGGRAFKLMFSSIAQNAAGAFAPVTETLEHVEGVIEDIKKKGNIGVRVTAVGAAGLGVGAGLQAFASQEQGAQQQLADAIQNTGHVYEEYGDDIEKTVKHGERFGVMGYQTMDVLNRLTLATNDPKKALADYQVVLDMAASRHMSVTRSAQMLASAYGGNTRVFRMFGLNVADQNKTLSVADKANKTATSTAEQLKKAREHLADTEARIGASRTGHAATAAQLATAEARVAAATGAVQTVEFKHGQQSPQAAAARARLAAAEANLSSVRAKGSDVTKLSVSQEIQLRRAHEAVADASAKYQAAVKEKTAADKAAKDAAHGVDGAVQQLSTRLSGQASAAADTWTGHLKGIGAELEDGAARIGAKYGPAVTAASTGVLALGTTMTIARGLIGKFTTANAAAAASEEAVGTASTVAAGEVEAGSAAMASTGMRNMGRLAGAVAGVAGAIGTFEVGKATAHSGAAGGAATTLMGAVSGAVAGMSIGGPLGAAIGGAVGGLAGLATHFVEAGRAASTSAGDIDKFTTSLVQSYQADKYRLGQQSRQQISDFLSQPKQSEDAQLLATAGVSMNQIITGIRSPGSTKAASMQVSRAYGQGQITGAEMNRLLDFLETLRSDFASRVGQADSVASINGVLGQATTDSRRDLAGLLTGRAGTSGPVGRTDSHLQSIHMTLLQIQHNTAKTSQHTDDTHKAVRQSNGAVRIGRSPELATL